MKSMTLAFPDLDKRICGSAAAGTDGSGSDVHIVGDDSPKRPSERRGRRRRSFNVKLSPTRRALLPVDVQYFKERRRTDRK
jgi:predicted nucleotidyltransferase